MLFGDPSDSSGDLARSVEGSLFWHDGTAVYEQLEVVIKIGRKRFSSKDDGNESDRDGRFRILIPYSKDDPSSSRSDQPLRSAPFELFVAGHEIPRKMISFTPEGRLLVIIPQVMWGRGKGDRGGIITGTVVDKHGSPIAGAKVSGELRSNKILGFLATSPPAETVTSRQGRFALEFRGGTELKLIYVNGHAPVRIYRRRRDGTEAELPEGRDIRAGSFGLIVERADNKLFGFLGG